MVRATPNDFENWLKATPPSAYNAKRLSESLHISLRQLHRYTQQFYGLTPKKWLDQQRIARALPLLMEHRSVKIVAGDIGFKQASHFSRVFKLVTGIAPTMFVDNLQKAQNSPSLQRWQG